MITFQVPGMTCGGCAARIARAVAGVDREARVEADIPARRVRVDSTAPVEDIGAAIDQAGYPPQLVHD